MKKIDIDGITLRYFPWIGVRFVRYVVCFFAFFVYSYLVFPILKITKMSSIAIVTFLLFVLFVFADHSHLLDDIPDSLLVDESGFEGELEEYEGRRGLGSAHMIVRNGKTLRFKLLSVRSAESREYLRSLIGQRISVRYIVANGLVTEWNLPVQIFSSSGEKIYDYHDHPVWFKSPASLIDRFIILLFQFMVIFAAFFLPVKSLLFLLGQEVRHEFTE